MTIIGAFAGLFLKKASTGKNIKSILFSVYLYLGGGLYFVSALLNIYLLKVIDYSVMLPLTSITYIWTLIVSYLFLSEKITVKKILGVAGIIIGSFVLVCG